MLRAQVSFAAMWAGECAFMVALGVVAYREGGVGAVGAVTAARMACAALLAPFLATLADRVRRERVLTGVGMVRAAMLGCAAVVTAAGGAAVATYGLAVIATIAMTMYRPAHSALLPALAKSPQELAGANAVRGMLDSLSTLGGPLVAAALLAASGPPAVFAVCAAASLLAALVVVGLPYDAPPRAADSGGAPGRVVLQGFAAIAGDRGLALITSLGLVQTFTRGCLTVFTVVVAIDLLGTGDPGVGVLNAAIGAGAVLGSIFAFGLVRRGGLAGWFGLGIALFGAPLALIGVLPGQVAAILLLGVVGIGNALIDVAGFTLLARRADEAVLARMFAGFEAILTLGFAVGGLLSPLLIEGLGVRGALGVVGVLAPLAVLISWPCVAPAQRRHAGPRRRHRDPAGGRHAGRPARGDDRAARCRAHLCRIRTFADGVRAGRPWRSLLRRRVGPGRGRPGRPCHRDARTRRRLRRNRSPQRRAAHGHDPRRHGMRRCGWGFSSVGPTSRP